MMIRRKERRNKVAERRKEAEQGGQNENEQRDEIYDRFMTHLSTLSQPTNQPKPGWVYPIVREEEEEFSKEKIQM